MSTFKRNQDAYQSLGVGVIHHVSVWLKERGVENFELERDQSTGTIYIDVNDDIYFHDLKFTDIYDPEKWPDYIRFRKITGVTVFQ